MSVRTSVIILMSFVPVIGCSSDSQKPIAVPKYDPDGSADAAIAAYDKNGDGYIDGNEARACPAIAAAVAGDPAVKPMIIALALGVTGPALAADKPSERPYSCRLLDDEQKSRPLCSGHRSRARAPAAEGGVTHCEHFSRLTQALTGSSAP